MTTTNTIIGLQNNRTCRSYHKAVTAECTQQLAHEYERVSPPDTTQYKYLGLRYIALDEIVENPVQKSKDGSHVNLQDVLIGLWKILFPDDGRENYRRLEGDDMTPITAYKSRNGYYAANGDNVLATARYLGQTYVLAEVWELS